MQMRSSFAHVLAAAMLCGAPSAVFADVIVVDAAGGADFTGIQGPAGGARLGGFSTLTVLDASIP